MAHITKRQFLIINHIADKTEFISSEEIAGSFHLSSKTVRSDIEASFSALYEKGINLEKKRSQGYYMDKENTEKWRKLGKDLLYTDNLTPSEYRFHYILERLLVNELFIKSVDLGEQLFVSQPIVSSELKKIRNHLKSYELTIENVPNYGIRITGKEQYFRSCMLEEYHYIHKRGIKTSVYPSFDRLFVLENRGIEKKISSITHSALEFQDGKPYYIFESYIGNVVVAIILSLNCANRKNKIQFSSQETYETQLTRSYKALDDLYTQLNHECGIELNLQEILYLANVMLGYRTFLRFEEVSVTENYYRAVNYATKSLNSLISRYGVVELAYSKQLRERLALHILAMEARIRTHMVASCDEDIEMNHHSVIAQNFANYVCTYLEHIYSCRFHKSEYEKMALIFLPEMPLLETASPIGCSVGVVSHLVPRDMAMALAMYNLNRFREMVARVQAYESYQLKEIVDSNMDILLTDMDVKLFEGFKGQILHYSFDASMADYYVIKDWRKRKPEKWNRIRQFFSEDLFFVLNEDLEEDKLRMEIGRRLEESGAVDESVYLDFEDMNKTAVSVSNNGIAFMKLKYTYGELSFASVFELENSVEWNGKEIHLMIVFSGGTMDPSDFLLFDGWMEMLLKNKKPFVLPSEIISFDKFMERLYKQFWNHK